MKLIVVIVDEKSLGILYESNPQKIIYPASLVKLMTAYLAFEAIKNNKFAEEDEFKRGEIEMSPSPAKNRIDPSFSPGSSSM